MSDKIYLPQNKNAQQCVKNVMKYLSDITYEKIVTGQHTQSMDQEELYHIKAITGNNLHCWVLSCYPIHLTSIILKQTKRVWMKWLKTMGH